MDRYIQDKILTVKALHCDQHAYRIGRSTKKALSKAVNLIEDQLNLKGFTIGTFIDPLRGIVDSGCPQEGVLFPQLWSLVMDELLHHRN